MSVLWQYPGCQNNYFRAGANFEEELGTNDICAKRSLTKCVRLSTLMVVLQKLKTLLDADKVTCEVSTHSEPAGRGLKYSKLLYRKCPRCSQAKTRRAVFCLRFPSSRVAFGCVFLDRAVCFNTRRTSKTLSREPQSLQKTCSTGMT